jgi:hypothetical protein
VRPPPQSTRLSSSTSILTVLPFRLLSTGREDVSAAPEVAGNGSTVPKPAGGGSATLEPARSYGDLGRCSRCRAALSPPLHHARGWIHRSRARWWWICPSEAYQWPVDLLLPSSPTANPPFPRTVVARFAAPVDRH